MTKEEIFDELQQLLHKDTVTIDEVNSFLGKIENLSIDDKICPAGATTHLFTGGYESFSTAFSKTKTPLWYRVCLLYEH